jgi:1-phosphofructokinase
MVLSPGGKGINVSVILTEWGIDSVATGFLGGNIGHVIEVELQRKHRSITTSFVKIADESRENIAILDEYNHTLTEVNEPGPTILEDDIVHFMKSYRSLVNRSHTVLISGSVPFGISLEMYATLTEIAHAVSAEVYMEARGKLLTYAVNENCPDIVRPDIRSDIRVLGKELETEKDYIEAGEKIIEKGAKLVVISYQTGSDFIFTRDGCWLLSIAEEKVEPSHLLGTGDTYIAAMIYYSKMIDADYFERAKFGMAAALAKTKYLWKQIPTIDEIREALPKLVVKSLKGRDI